MDLLYEQDGMAVYKREYQEETSVVAINNTTETQTVAIPAEELAGGADNKELRGMLNGDLVRDKDKQYTITIDRDESEIYVLSEKSGINLYLFDQSWSGSAVIFCFHYTRIEKITSILIGL